MAGHGDYYNLEGQLYTFKQIFYKLGFNYQYNTFLYSYAYYI